MSKNKRQQLRPHPPNKLERYFNQRTIQTIIPASDYLGGLTVRIQTGDDKILIVPIICWALIEFYHEDKDKNGTVVTASFIDPIPNFDEDGNLVMITALTTLDVFVRHHPECDFLGFGGPNAKTAISDSTPEPTSISPDEG